MTLSGSLAPAKRATSTAMPVNSELMKTMTTRMICQLTPMAALRGVADEVADHRVVDDALQPGDDVLQHRRPRESPDRRADGTFDDRAIEFLGT